MSSPSDFTAAASALAVDGWCMLSHVFDETQTRALAQECAAMHDARQLLPARTGGDRATSALRGDSTHWFASGTMTAPQQMFTERMDELRQVLGRELMLSLVDCESHYAVYRPGARYARHLDRLRGNDTRVISAVCYLNDNWLETQGGALRLYLGDGGHRDIYPQAGHVLLFLSGRFEHEVLPATRDRMSIASWMRQRPVGTNG